MAPITLTANPDADCLPDALREKYWERKHGQNAYYGQE